MKRQVDQDTLDRLEVLGLPDVAGDFLLLRAEVKRLKEQRDEARKNYCYYVAADRSNPDHPNYEPHCDLTSARKVADEMGWDCFDNDNNTGDK